MFYSDTFNRLRLPLAFAAGALAPLSFSPLNLWPLALLALALLYFLLDNTTPKRAALTSWCFGFGFFGTGASWVYVSIHDYGNAPPLLAGFLTLLFVAGLATLFALQGWGFRKFGAARYPVAGFAATWLLGEWLRSWLLTGFPWLYLGYAHVTTLFAGLAPLFGVFGISFVLALSSALLVEGWRQFQYRDRSKPPLHQALRGWQQSLCLLVLWTLSALSGRVNWVTPVLEGTLDVALVQANIPQELKFADDALENNFRTQMDLSEPLWNHDLVVWSETALPLVYATDSPLLNEVAAVVNGHDSTLLTGIFARTDAGLHNSLAVLGNGSGLWHKQKLVPFGEYTPLRGLLGPMLELFALPMSSLVPGPARQELLTAAGSVRIAPFICYEVVYPEFVRRYAQNADLLVTVSNDTWFGASWGPPQHLQMAAMRALENGRYMVRATNNGISALIDERGHIVARAPQFEAATLSGTVQLFTGHTPWSRWGNWPLLVLCWLLLLANFYQIRSPSLTTGKS